MLLSIELIVPNFIVVYLGLQLAKRRLIKGRRNRYFIEDLKTTPPLSSQLLPNIEGEIISGYTFLTQMLQCSVPDFSVS